MNDGTVVDMKTVATHSEKNDIKMKWVANEPLVIEQIRAITINGFDVAFQ